MSVDSDDGKGGGGFKEDQKALLRLGRSPGSVKSASSLVIPPTFEEIVVTMELFLSEIGTDAQVEQNLKESSKLLYNKGIIYGSKDNNEKSTENDVLFIDVMNSVVNGEHFGGKDVFKNFMNGVVSIESFDVFVKEILEIVKKGSTRAQSKIKPVVQVTMEKIQFMLAKNLLRSPVSSSSFSSSSSSSSGSSEESNEVVLSKQREDYEYDFESMKGTMVIPSPYELKDTLNMSKATYIFGFLQDISVELEKESKVLRDAVIESQESNS